MRKTIQCIPFYLSSSKKKKELVEEKNSKIKLLWYFVYRIRENSWEKIRFSPSLSVDRISSPPPRNGGASSPCFVHDTYRILEGEGKGWIAVPFEKFSLKITIRYNCKWEIILDSCLNWFRWLIGSKSNRWYKQVNF